MSCNFGMEFLHVLLMTTVYSQFLFTVHPSRHSPIWQQLVWCDEETLVSTQNMQPHSRSGWWKGIYTDPEWAVILTKILIFIIVQLNEFRGVEYSAAVADFFTYDNLRPAEDWHPKIQDVVYWGKGVIIHLVLWSQAIYLIWGLLHLTTCWNWKSFFLSTP